MIDEAVPLGHGQEIFQFTSSLNVA
jgi:hypothetical protein